MNRRHRLFPGGRCGRHFGCGTVLGGGIHHHVAQLHRHLCAGRARPRAVDRSRRTDVVWPGRLRRHRRLRDSLADDGLRRVAVAWAAVRTGGNRSHRRTTRRGHAPARRTLPAARHHRLGPVDLFSVRQYRCARRPQRPDRRTADLGGSDLRSNARRRSTT